MVGLARVGLCVAWEETVATVLRDLVCDPSEKTLDRRARARGGHGVRPPLKSHTGGRWGGSKVVRALKGRSARGETGADKWHTKEGILQVAREIGAPFEGGPV